MMYANKMAVAIKTNSRVLREYKDTVFIKFGSEYSVYMKNLNTTRAVVNVFIDGNNITPGGLVIDPGKEVDLERSIANGNLKEGNALKFIERTGKIEQHRGIGAEDGLIRVEYQFELPRPVFNVNQIVGSNYFPHYPPGIRGWSDTSGSTSASEYPGVTDKFSNTKTSGWIQSSGATYSQVNVNGALRGVDYSANGAAMQASAAAAIDKVAPQSTELHDGMATMDWCQNETGITVPGSKSEQKFQHTTMGALDPAKHTIVLHIVGDLGHNKPVEQPVTVKHKQECVTCGKKNKATAKYCTECGTALEIFA